ncbi:Dedicator of cytokinesis protein 2 [Oopsacas minuta]|uniref:Dedicator of cytokinesis protein 2 n=1 Tax=Oopsacas minuta TaxID=111878 RepID=A0AAV7JSG9_9METZ|nr:Dedicator of cytokinesis protein 2 [Oopsacas minuta]
MPTLALTLQNVKSREDSRIGVHLISSFIGLLDCIQDEQFSLYMSMENFPCAEDLENFMLNMFSVFSLLLDKNIYPIDWMIVQLRKDSIFLKKIFSISDALDLDVSLKLF